MSVVIVICLFIGAMLGWVNSVVMGTVRPQGVVLNVVTGIAGALLGGWIVAPLIGGAGMAGDGLKVIGVIAAFICAAGVLATANMMKLKVLR